MRFASLLLVGFTAVTASAQSSWPLFGGSPSRNMVNLTDKGIPLDFRFVDDDGKPAHKNIKWVAALGSKAYGGPVVAGGKVFVGTNNSQPREADKKGNLAVLMCFDAGKGTFLWQITHPMPDDPIFHDVTGPRLGLLSTPVVDGDMLFYVLPGAEVVAATTQGKVAWTFDMMKKLDVVPFHCSNCSPLVVDDLVVLLTGNGHDDKLGKVPSPKAPSFLALNKKDGSVAWKSSLPGDKIIEGQWSNPAVAVIGGKKQIIFPGGDGVIYALDAKDGTLVWQFNCHPKGVVREAGEPIPPYFVSTPVVHESKVFIGMGTYPEHAAAPRASHFLCIDASRKGDISPKSLDHKDAANKDSGLVWSYGGAIVPRPKKGRSVIFGVTLSTAAVHDGLVFISEESGYLHCLDAKAGERQWVYDFKTAIWGSPYVVDGKVLLAVEDGMLHVLAADRKMKLLVENEKKERMFVDKVGEGETPGISTGEALHSTPVVADGTLYLLTSSQLYAIDAKKK